MTSAGHPAHRGYIARRTFSERLNNIALIKMAEQLNFDLVPRTWGGKREGAGRKKSKDSHDPPHRSRPMHVARFPVHVVLRALPEVGRLRNGKVRAAVARALEKVAERADEFRVVHFSIQHDHLHFLVEASGNDALESGMRALAISLARRLNRALGRRGRVFEYRYHTTALRSPRQTRNAIAYVLNNWRRHREDERGLAERFAKVDPYSNGITFDRWHDWRPSELPTGYVAFPVATARTWLLERGWLLAKRPISTWQTPGRLEA